LIIIQLFLFLLTFVGCSSEQEKIAVVPVNDISKNIIVETTSTPEVTIDPMPADLIAKSSQENITQSSNIQNGGHAFYENDTLYFVKKGLNSSNKHKYNVKQLSSDDSMLYINKNGDFIYYVSSLDYNVYKLDITKDEEPIKLGLNGAYYLMVIGDYIYYQSAIGETADFFLYRASLDGSNPENLDIKSSSFCIDGHNIYFANLEDDSKLYMLDMSNGEIEQLSNNRVRQLNLINNNLYYINKTTGNITKLDINTLESKILKNSDCTYLNTNGKILVYSCNEPGGIGTMNLDGSEQTQILNYKDVNGLNVAGSWIFFESYSTTIEPIRFSIKTDGTELSEPLPLSSLAKIVDYNPETNIITCDFIEYYTGDEAIKKYTEDFSLSVRKAKKELEKTNGIYIHNPNPKLREYKILDVSDLILAVNPDGSYNTDGYTADIDTFNRIYNKDDKHKLIFDNYYHITGYNGDVVSLIQFYQPIN
jgi:hypothetical protein